MRWLNVLAAALVLVGAVVVSYTHTAQLFAQNGYSGWLVHVGVGVVELTFLMGALNIVTARVKGVRVGVPPMLGGLLGVLVVGYSNVRAGLAYGWEGVALGAVIPLSLIVTEGIMAWAILNGRKEQEPPTQESETAQQIAQRVKDPAQQEEEPPKQVDPSPTQLGEVGENAHPVTQRGEDSPAQSPTEPEPIARVGEKPPKRKQEQAKPPTPTPTPIVTQTPPGDPVEIAARIAKEEGKPPSRRKLAQIAGISEYKARQALARLKEAM